MTKRRWRILNTETNKCVKNPETNKALALEFPRQAEEYIDRRLNGSRVYKIIEWKRKVK